MKLILGASGWSYDEWVGSFYETKARKFSQYTKLFNASEINSTFYRYPTEGMVRGLYRYSPPGFIFAAKVPQLITHKKRLRLYSGVEDDINRFLDIMRPLAEKMGPFLIQLPPSFTYEGDGVALEEFIEVLPENYEFAVEFRDLSWMRPETFDMLREHRVAYTIVDEPLLPPDIHVTADFAYIRWHGHGSPTWYSYDYSHGELEEWVPKVRNLSSQVDRVYGFFNNHFRWQEVRGGEKWGYPGAVKNVLEFMEMLDMATDDQKEALNKINTYISEK